MLRVEGGRAEPYCDGVRRRSFLQIGLAGMGAWSLPEILAARDKSVAAGGPKKDTSVILLWLDGGPSHIDTYDMKPLAPIEYRGIWDPISTNVAGTFITQLFPLQAQIADKFSVIRSMHHDSGDHFTGAHWMLTGRNAGVSGANTDGKFPFFGGIATKLAGSRASGMPANVALPHAMSVGKRPGYFGGNYLGNQYDPFETKNDPNRDNFRVENLSLVKDLTLDRLQDRRKLLEHFDTMRRDADASGQLASLDHFGQQAWEMVSGSRARDAFDISQEPDAVRERYGRNPWGQNTLLARRLVEAGTTFVTCHFGGWDTHWDLQERYVKDLPKIDQLASALICDLDERGLLDRVMVVLCGEFGRTPRMNDGGNGGPPGSKGTPGRDHWGTAMSVLVAGGGIRGGQMIGTTNAKGEAPADRPLKPGDLHHTVFEVLGVNPHVSFTDFSGRPIPAIDHGGVIEELF